MPRIIETNLSMVRDFIKDHQSRIVEIDSWNEYIQKIKENHLDLENKSRDGTILPIPIGRRAFCLTFDDFHLSFISYNSRNQMTKTLSYLIRE
ncbi:hypothetical protein BEH_07730 [Priestia filamentosa]|uniref:Uncharacterized protein n=1 Tax=Priestia filamentosa TaxID=1402861 RepID=A0A0H4KI78_9BACI|nr:hypothetical protein [Priestia filamentosa]AKO91999.1 hypothetical protein BEH_07730 [Priestia filamentosa]